MSGIAGIFYRDGRPVERADVTRMVDTIAHRGPDGASVWVDGAVGLGHRMLHTTPESLHEHLPLTSRCGNYTITADCRIDNRDELIPLLGLNDRPRELICDTEIILEAYVCWGERCPEKLLGDFVFAIWDRDKQNLFCARDFIGTRPFYYYLHDTIFAFGSELSSLFSNPDLPRTPNPGMVVEYLLSNLTNKEETLYQNIMRLAPGQTLSVNLNSMRKTEITVIDFGAPIRYRSDADYAEHFQALLEEAVRCRMRSITPVGSHLSGGLDSTSVAVTAYELYTKQGCSPSGFETYSQVFPGLSCDETGYIDQVCQRAGFVSNRVIPQVLGIEYYQEQAQRYRDFPDYPNGGYMSNPLNELARQKGVRVMLTGHGGNQWLEGQFEHLTDLIRHKQLGVLIRQLRGISYVFDRSWQSLVLTYGIKPFLPGWLFQAARWMLGQHDILPDWISPELLKHSWLFDCDHEQKLQQQHTSHAQAATYAAATGGWLAHANEMCERIAAQAGIEERHPLHDRRIVQFALNIPSEQIWRGDKVKFVMRQSMARHLPSSVLERTTQAQFADLFSQTFREINIRKLCANLQIAQVGWVDGTKVQRMAEESMRVKDAKRQPVAHMWSLCGVFGIEIWYSSLGRTAL